MILIFVWILAILAFAVWVDYVCADEASYYTIESLKREGQWSKTKGVMANGQKYDENKYTCASNDYPFGTILKVTNTQTDKSVDVMVTDRGGFKKYGRNIDLSKAAFSKIANLKSGVIKVRIEKHETS